MLFSLEIRKLLSFSRFYCQITIPSYLPGVKSLQNLLCQVLLFLFQADNEFTEATAFGLWIELLLNNLVPGSGTGVGGTWEAENILAVCSTTEGTRLQSTDSYFLRTSVLLSSYTHLKGQITKDLTKPFNFFVKQRLYGFWCNVSSGDARASCCNDYVAIV